jgi:Flp pilus assembly pilin Flp
MERNQVQLGEVTCMVRMYAMAHRLWSDVRGQDLIEYALLAATLAVVVAGFLPPTIMPAVSTIFSKVISGFNAS